MVFLNGRALPQYSQNNDSSSSTLFDDLRHLDRLQSKRDDDCAEDRVRRPEPVSNASDPIRRQSYSPRRPRPSATARGPRPLLPRSLKEALQLAELLAKSKLIPKGFETPETCLVGILYGMEVGLSPIAALQRMAVIDGRPTIWGDAALALVQSSGLLQSIREEIMETQAVDRGDGNYSSDSKDRSGNSNVNSVMAICTVEREGRSEPTIGTFSIDDAKRAGLWQKPGPWTDYPKRMLTMRARAFALRDAFPDVLAGLYIREEFEGAESRYKMPKSNLNDSRPRRDSSTEDAEWGRADTKSEFGKTNPNQSCQNKDLANQVLRRAPPPPPAPLEVLVADDANVAANKSSKIPASDASCLSQAIEAETDLFDPEIILDLFDSALCCALDLPTLEEIIDEFTDRLKKLPPDVQERAQRIIGRHQSRVENLDRSPASGQHANWSSLNDFHHAELAEQDAATPEEALSEMETSDIDMSATSTNLPAPLPRGLKALLPNLGLGHIPSNLRRRKNRDRHSRSLASWNARTRLSEFKSQTPENECLKTDVTETEE